MPYRNTTNIHANRADRYLRRAAVAAVFAALATLAVSVVHPDVPAAHDTIAHFTYTSLFHHAIADGQFPVRWVESIRPGHGQPLFNFYQPGLYYLVELVHLAVPSLSLSLQLTVVLLWISGGAFMFLLIRPHAGSLPAALAAIVFILTPYLIVDVFVRGAYPELAAIALSIGVLWSIDRALATRRLVYRLALTLLLGLCLICHLPTLLIFAPVFVAYALVASRVDLRRLLTFVPAFVLALGLAAFYVIPALAEINHVQMARLTAGGFDYHHHFVTPARWLDTQWGYGGSADAPADRMSVQIGPGQWLVLALAALTLLSSLRRRSTPQNTTSPELSTHSERPTPRHQASRDSRHASVLFWLAIVAGAMLMMTRLAAPVWEALPPLAFLQYPWRFLMLIAVACAALAGVLLARIERPWQQAVIVITATCGLLFFSYDHLQPRGYYTRAEIDIDRPGWRAAEGANKVVFFEAGYQPVSVEQLPAEPVGRWMLDDTDEGAADEGAVDEGPTDEGTADESAVRVVSDADHELVLDVHTPSSAAGDRRALTINTPYFPGWRIWLDGREVPFATQSDTGYMRVDMPPGSHRLEARFTNTNVRTWANAVSAMSLVTFGALLGLPVASRLLGGVSWRPASARTRAAARRPSNATSGRA